MGRRFLAEQSVDRSVYPALGETDHDEYEQRPPAEDVNDGDWQRKTDRRKQKGHHQDSEAIQTIDDMPQQQGRYNRSRHQAGKNHSGTDRKSTRLNSSH